MTISLLVQAHQVRSWSFQVEMPPPSPPDVKVAASRVPVWATYSGACGHELLPEGFTVYYL